MRPTDAAQLVLLGAIWGSSFLFIEVALDDLSPIHIVAGRLFLGALFLAAIVKATGRKLPRKGSTWRALAFMALVSNVVPFGLITWGQQEISSSLAAILNSTTPLFTATLASFLVVDEELTFMRGFGIGVGFLGVVTIVGIDAGGGTMGKLAVVAASLSYGTGFVFARRHVTGGADGALTLSAGQLMIGSAITAPLAVRTWLVDPPTPSWTAIASVAILGLAGAGLGFVIYYRLVASVGATTASFVNYLLPLFGALLGALVLNEQIGSNTVIGGLLVLIGIAIAGRAGGRRDRAVKPVIDDAGGTRSTS